MIDVEKEGGLFAERAADVAVIEDGVVAGLFSGTEERIPRVESVAVAVNHELSVEFVGAGLGEDFDAAVAELVVLRGKRILIDADFTDGRLRGKLARGEAVNVDLSAIGAGGR